MVCAIVYAWIDPGAQTTSVNQTRADGAAGSNRRWRLKLVVSFLALGLSTLLGVQDAGAGTIRHDVPDQDYTNLAAQPQFASVGSCERYR